MGGKKLGSVVQPEPQVLVFDNGLQFVYMHYPSSGAGIFGISVRAGSADEAEGCFGLAHFVEHTLFKGTKKRSSWHIINRMEAIGGELNAFTTKEETVVYSIFPSGNESRACELIADLAINSQFPEREIEKEREVVIDEINSYRDTPAESIYDEFEEHMLSGSSLAHNILGSPESVMALSSNHCRDFLSTNYTTGNMVAFYSGPAPIGRIAHAVATHFTLLPIGSKQAENNCEPTITGSFNKYIKLDIHQTHALIGARIGGMFSPQKYAVALFSNIVGGPGMNSLLNIELRERRGLVYSVEASTSLFSTCGLINIYFGCDAHDLNKCRKICTNVFSRLADGKLTERALSAAKKQYMGQFAIASENRENKIMTAARTLLFCGTTGSYTNTLNGINRVSAHDIQEIAALMCNASSLVYSSDGLLC